MKLQQALAATCIVALGMFSHAQTSDDSASDSARQPSGKIGFVDIDKITTKAKQSSEMNKMSADVRKIQTDFQKKLDKKRELERDIQKTKGIVSADETAAKNKEIDRLTDEMAGMEAKYKRELQKIDDYLFTPLVKKIGYAIEDVAKERNFDLVLRGEAVFYGHNSVDLTEDVIKLLDLEGLESTSSAKASRSASSKRETGSPATIKEATTKSDTSAKANTLSEAAAEAATEKALPDPTSPAASSDENKSDAPATKSTRVRPVDRQTE